MCGIIFKYSISNNDPAIPFDQIYEVTKTAIEISKSMQ